MIRIYALARYAEPLQGSAIAVGLYRIDSLADVEDLGPLHRQDGSVAYLAIDQYWLEDAPLSLWRSWEGWGYNGGAEGVYLTAEDGGILAGTPIISNGVEKYPDIDNWLSSLQRFNNAVH